MCNMKANTPMSISCTLVNVEQCSVCCHAKLCDTGGLLQTPDFKTF